MGWWRRTREAIDIERAILALENHERRDHGVALFHKLGEPERLSPRYLELVRLVRNERSPEHQRMRLVVHGTPEIGKNAPVGASGFMRHYLVIAKDLESALRFVRELDPERGWATIVVERCEDSQSAAGELAGIIEASGAIWYGGAEADTDA